MSVKNIEVGNVGQVKVYRRRGAKSMRLGISPNGDIRLTLPYWVSLRTGLRFVQSRQEWLKAQLTKHSVSLDNGMAIGKSHHVTMTPHPAKLSCQLVNTEIRIKYPPHLSTTDEEVQSAARRGIVRALRREAENLLPERLSQLSQKHGLKFKSVQIKQLRARWGSCSAEGDIVLNLFLMQLPWHLIDYVLVHELAHTRHFGHGADFWETMTAYSPETKQLRKEIRTYRPSISLVR